MGNRLDAKVCLITGAGSGIGQASARLFAQEGARVVVADIDFDSARETVAGIGDTAVAQLVDVPSPRAPVALPTSRRTHSASTPGCPAPPSPPSWSAI